MKKFDIQSQVVIMCGISGSGKTHHARTLTEKGYIHLSVDALIWDKVGADLFTMPKEEQRNLFAEYRREVCNQLVSFLISGKKVVVDSTHCRRSGRDEIRDICTKMGVKPVFVYCHADKDELWERLSKRKGTGPDDLIVTKEELSEYWQGFERPQDDESDFIFLK